MPQPTPAMFPTEPDSSRFGSVAVGKRICLIAIGALAFLSLCVRLIPALGRTPLAARLAMNPAEASCALLCVIAFQLTRPSAPRRLHLFGVTISASVTLFALFGLLGPILHLAPANAATAISAPIAGGFLLFGLATQLIHTQDPKNALLADMLLLALCYLVLVFISGDVFRSIAAPAGSARSGASMLTLICLSLLTWLAIQRHTATRVFAIFLDRGMGGSIARTTSPALLILPFLRETARIGLISQGRVPPAEVTALVTSFAAMLYFCLLLYVARRINKMEREISDLSLRDALTGLYNLRGFNLLAQQSLRLAQRTEVPFSVLFIDLDNLKQINDTFGHNAGSAVLAETAALLKQTFRETDIIGRIGGDEFAVAGQFSRVAISTAIQRLRESAALRNAEIGFDSQLNFSIGQSTADPPSSETLLELLNRADNAMYEEKKQKKTSRV